MRTTRPIGPLDVADPPVPLRPPSPSFAQAQQGPRQDAVAQPPAAAIGPGTVAPGPPALAARAAVAGQPGDQPGGGLAIPPPATGSAAGGWSPTPPSHPRPPSPTPAPTLAAGPGMAPVLRSQVLPRATHLLDELYRAYRASGALDPFFRGLLASGRICDAATLALFLRHRYPEATLFVYWQAATAVLQGSTDQALAALVAQRLPPHWVHLFTIARLVEDIEPAAACRLLEACLHQHPRAWVCYEALAGQRLQLGAAAEAHRLLAALEAGCGLSPAGRQVAIACAIAQERYDEARAHQKQWRCDADDLDRPPIYFANLAAILAAEGEAGQAASAFWRACLGPPVAFQVEHCIRAACILQDPELMAGSFHMALAMPFVQASAVGELARSYERMGRVDRALNLADRACRRAPGSVGPLRYRAQLLAAHNRPLEAGAGYDLALLARARADAAPKPPVGPAQTPAGGPLPAASEAPASRACSEHGGCSTAGLAGPEAACDAPTPEEPAALCEAEPSMEAGHGSGLAAPGTASMPPPRHLPGRGRRAASPPWVDVSVAGTRLRGRELGRAYDGRVAVVTEAGMMAWADWEHAGCLPPGGAVEALAADSVVPGAERVAAAVWEALVRPRGPGLGIAPVRLLRALAAHGDCLVCGGLVRDAVAGRPIEAGCDVDLVCSRDPQFVRVVGASAMGDWPGIDGRPAGVVSGHRSEFFGLVRFGWADGGGTHGLADVVSMRTAGAHAPVGPVLGAGERILPLAFGPDLLADARARCFTINALFLTVPPEDDLDAWRAHCRLVDPLGQGCDDARAGVLRACSPEVSLVNETWGWRYAKLRRRDWRVLPETLAQVEAHFRRMLAGSDQEVGQWLARCQRRGAPTVDQVAAVLEADGLAALASRLRERHTAAGGWGATLSTSP